MSRRRRSTCTHRPAEAQARRRRGATRSVALPSSRCTSPGTALPAMSVASASSTCCSTPGSGRASVRSCWRRAPRRRRRRGRRPRRPGPGRCRRRPGAKRTWVTPGAAIDLGRPRGWPGPRRRGGPSRRGTPRRPRRRRSPTATRAAGGALRSRSCCSPTRRHLPSRRAGAGEATRQPTGACGVSAVPISAGRGAEQRTVRATGSRIRVLRRRGPSVGSPGCGCPRPTARRRARLRHRQPAVGPEGARAGRAPTPASPPMPG